MEVARADSSHFPDEEPRQACRLQEMGEELRELGHAVSPRLLRPSRGSGMVGLTLRVCVDQYLSTFFSLLPPYGAFRHFFPRAATP